MARRRKETKKPRVLAMAAIAIAFVGAGAFAYGLPMSSDAASSVAAGPRFSWPRGSRTVYDVRWSVDTRSPIGDKQSLDGSAELEADLVVRSLGAKDGVYELLYQLENARTYRVTLVGRDAITPENAEAAKRALTEEPALVRVDARGVLKSITFRSSASNEARQSLQRIVQATQVTLAEGSETTWDAVETSLSGTAHVRYALGLDQSLHVTRHRLRYEKLTVLPSLTQGEVGQRAEIGGRALIVLDGHGGIESIDEDEELTAGSGGPPQTATTKLSLVKKSMSTFDAKRVAADGFDQTAPRATAPPFDGKHHDEQISAGLSAESIYAQLRAAANGGGSMSGGLMARIGAFARLHPEEIDTLLAMFQAPDANEKMRSLVLDAFTSAGNAAAQAALRNALASPEARSDKRAYLRYLQRLMFLDQPNRDSGAFGLSIYDEAKKNGDGETRASAAVALGGLARNLRMKGEAGLAEQIHAELARDLDEAQTTYDRVYLLRGLGNLGDASDAERLSRFARDPAVGVRDQLAWSLRLVDSPIARATLFGLVADESPGVAANAFRSLERQPLSNEDWTTLETIVTSGHFNQEADSKLVSLVGKRRVEAGAHARPILEYVRAHLAHGDHDLEKAVRVLLEQPEGATATANDDVEP